MSNNDLFLDEEDLTGMPSKEDRILAAVCYAHFLFLAPFLLQKDSEFLVFHMKQGCILYILFLLVSIVSLLFLPYNLSMRFEGIAILLYTLTGIFVGYRAYIGQKVELKFLRKLVAMLTDFLNSKKQ